MTILYLLAGLLFLHILIAWYSYRTAFYSPAKRKEDHYSIPKGEQYQKDRQRTERRSRSSFTATVEPLCGISAAATSWHGSPGRIPS